MFLVRHWQFWWRWDAEWCGIDECVCVGPVGPARQPFVEQGAGSDGRREPPLALHRETTTPVSMATLISSTPASRLPRTTSTRRTPRTLPKRPTRGREVF